jgi:hypothetical protein
MRYVVVGIEKVLILRRPRRGRLEGRTALVQPDFNSSRALSIRDAY